MPQAGGKYVLSYALNTHQSCGGDVKTLNVYIDGALLTTETLVWSKIPI